jgi:hypothetical protein
MTQEEAETREFVAAVTAMPPAALPWLAAMMRCIIEKKEDHAVREAGLGLGKACGHKNPALFAEKAVQIVREVRPTAA